LGSTTKPSICRICGQGCGILVTEDPRHGLQIEGNPGHPVSEGFICFRGKHFAKVHHAPDRLKQPLLRKGSRLQEISYEDALDLVASNLLKCKENYGAESVVLYKGESLKHQELAEYFRHLAYGFGSPNYVAADSICHSSMVLGFGLTSGGIPGPDFKRINTAVAWGTNPAVSSPRMFSRLRKAMMKGTRLMVIDPTRTATAKAANLHLPITPGSDGLIALAFIKYAIENGCVTAGPPRESGFADLKDEVSRLSYEDVAARTGISRALFLEACSMIFQNTPGWIASGYGLESQPHGVQTIRALASLQSILDPEQPRPQRPCSLAPLPGADRYPRMAEPIGAREMPVFTRQLKGGQGMVLTRAILENEPYPVRAMLVIGGNPLLTFPDPKTHASAFGALDFLAVSDLFMTKTARQADLVIPASDFLENRELHDYGRAGPPYLGLVQPVTEEHTGWPAWKLIFELALRLGLKSLFPWPDNRHAIAHRLSGSGIDLSDLETSPSATVSYAHRAVADGATSRTVTYRSETLEETGQAGLPFARILTLPSHTDQEFPFWLSTGDRVPFFQHSQFRTVGSYREAFAEPLLDMHPEAARKSGIGEGDYVELSTRYGKIEIRVSLNDDMREDCLRVTHGWEEANANELTGLADLDPISGFPRLKALPSKVTRRTV
jgi:formate dehydrogenase (coenzyme F420) alpha subunit